MSVQHYSMVCGGARLSRKCIFFEMQLIRNRVSTLLLLLLLPFWFERTWRKVWLKSQTLTLVHVPSAPVPSSSWRHIVNKQTNNSRDGRFWLKLIQCTYLLTKNMCNRKKRIMLTCFFFLIYRNWFAIVYFVEIH